MEKVKTLVIDEGLHKRFKTIASSRGINLLTATESAISDWCDRKDKKPFKIDLDELEEMRLKAPGNPDIKGLLFNQSEKDENCESMKK